MNIKELKDKGVDVDKIIALLSINALLPDVIESNVIEIDYALKLAGVKLHNDKSIMTRIKSLCNTMIAGVMKQLSSDDLENNHAKDSDTMKKLIDLFYKLDDKATVKAESTLKILCKTNN